MQAYFVFGSLATRSLEVMAEEALSSSVSVIAGAVRIAGKRLKHTGIGKEILEPIVEAIQLVRVEAASRSISQVTVPSIVAHRIPPIADGLSLLDKVSSQKGRSK